MAHLIIEVNVLGCSWCAHFCSGQKSLILDTVRHSTLCAFPYCASLVQTNHFNLVVGRVALGSGVRMPQVVGSRGAYSGSQVGRYCQAPESERGVGGSRQRGVHG